MRHNRKDLSWSGSHPGSIKALTSRAIRFAFVAIAIALASPATADEFEWDGGSTFQAFESPGNWLPSTGAPPSAGDTAVFSSLTAGVSIQSATLNGDRNLDRFAATGTNLDIALQGYTLSANSTRIGGTAVWSTSRGLDLEGSGTFNAGGLSIDDAHLNLSDDIVFNAGNTNLGGMWTDAAAVRVYDGAEFNAGQITMGGTFFHVRNGSRATASNLELEFTLPLPPFDSDSYFLVESNSELLIENTLHVWEGEVRAQSNSTIVVGTTSPIVTPTPGLSHLAVTDQGHVIATGIDQGSHGASTGLVSVAGDIAIEAGGVVTLEPYGQISSSYSINNSGLIRGEGAITGNLINSGVVAPGDSYTHPWLPLGGTSVADTGTLGFLSNQGNYEQLDSGLLLIDLLSDSDFDVLQVNHATLDGGLTVNLLSGFEPQKGDSFTIIEGSLISGEFDTGALSLPALTEPGAYWDIEYTTSNVTLHVVPEPATWILASISIALLILRSRRRFG